MSRGARGLSRVAWRARDSPTSLFLGSDDAGTVNATFTSLLASCRMHGVEPWAYLRDLLCLLPRWPEHRLLELSPLEWSSTRLRPDVVDRLEGNAFRKLTLDTGAPPSS
jgi:transposase